MARNLVGSWGVILAGGFALASPLGCSSDNCQQTACPTASFCDKQDQCVVDGAKFVCVAPGCYGASLSAGATHTLTLAFSKKPEGTPPDLQLSFSQPVGNVKVTAGSVSCSGSGSASLVCRGIPATDGVVTVDVPSGSADVTMGIVWVDQSCVDANAACGK